MNTRKREHREAQLAKKAETLKAFASEIVMQNETEMLIDDRPYRLVANHKEGFKIETLKERFSDILTKYDYIVGDWGYDQLRLRGFYKTGNNKGVKSQDIRRLEDYLYEYCNFGCAYFVLENLAVKEPEPIPIDAYPSKKRHDERPRSKKASRKQKNNEIESKIKRNKGNRQVSKRYFTIRQSD